MEKIFRVKPLPESFKFEGVSYPGVTFAGPDGPPSVLYYINISGADYPRLVHNLADEKTIFNFHYGRMQAVSEFDASYWEAILMSKWEPEQLSQQPDMFDVPTTTTEGYVRHSYIVADLRSSETVRIFLTTKFPYDD